MKHHPRHAKPVPVAYPAALAAVAVTAGAAFGGPAVLPHASLHLQDSAQPDSSLAPLADTHPGAPAADVAAQASLEYTVQDGDTLSSIAAGHGLNWTQLWAANAALVRNPDVIQPGWHLLLQPGVLTPSMQAELSRLLAPPPAQPAPSSDVSAPSPQPVTVTADVSTSGDSSFQACVIARESGGNPDVWNASGHWGLYQFSASTWAAYGGNPADFGHASVAEQDQVFANAMDSPGGEGNWAPYDGC
jgi:LysM domain/Transglycosylase-like domain